MKTYLYIIIIIFFFPCTAQDKEPTLSEREKRDLVAIAEAFIDDLYNQRYDSCLNNYELSREDSEDWGYYDIEESIKYCQETGDCYLEESFEFKELYTKFKHAAYNNRIIKEVDIYFDFNGKGYSRIQFKDMDQGKGWFINYIDGDPESGLKWTSYEKLEEKKN